jgi:hypothetical protein
MTARFEIKLAVFSLLAIQIVTSFGAIALLGRSDGAVAAAGAWAMVILALLGLVASAFVLRRLVLRIAVPLERIDEALQDHERGDGFRRCRFDEAPQELSRIAASVSALMDPHVAADEDPREAAAADRAALLHLLDAMISPTAVVNRHGVPTALSASALARLESDAGDGLRRALEAAVSGRPSDGIASATPIGDGTLFLCALR